MHIIPILHEIYIILKSRYCAHFYCSSLCLVLGNCELQLSQAGGVDAAVCQRRAKLCDRHVD